MFFWLSGFLWRSAKLNIILHERTFRFCTLCNVVPVKLNVDAPIKNGQSIGF